MESKGDIRLSPREISPVTLVYEPRMMPLEINNAAGNDPWNEKLEASIACLKLDPPIDALLKTNSNLEQHKSAF